MRPGFFRFWQRKSQSRAFDGVLQLLRHHPVLTGRNTIYCLERPRKIKRVVVAEGRGDFFDIQRCAVKQAAGILHAQMDEKVDRRASRQTLEQSRVMGRRDVHDASQSRNVQGLVQVLQHVRNALLDFLRNVRAAIRAIPFRLSSLDTKRSVTIDFHLFDAISFHLLNTLSVLLISSDGEQYWAMSNHFYVD